MLYNLHYISQVPYTFSIFNAESIIIAMTAVIASIVAVTSTGNRAYAATLVPLPRGYSRWYSSTKYTIQFRTAGRYLCMLYMLSLCTKSR